MAWCYCDECKYKTDCKYYRKVITCPYLEKTQKFSQED